MAQACKGKLNYRCPSCFTRDIDIDLFYDKEKDEYYCLRCGFKGDEKAVVAHNEIAKLKYKNLKKRVISFGKDNEPILLEDYKE